MTDALVKNASDKGQVEKAASKAKQRERLRQDEVKAVLSTRLGRAWFWRRMSDYRVFTTTFAGDPYRTAFNEGLRSAGLDLLNDVNSLDPSVYLEMAREAREDSERGL